MLWLQVTVACPFASAHGDLGIGNNPAHKEPHFSQPLISTLVVTDNSPITTCVIHDLPKHPLSHPGNCFYFCCWRQVHCKLSLILTSLLISFTCQSLTCPNTKDTHSTHGHGITSLIFNSPTVFQDICH